MFADLRATILTWKIEKRLPSLRTLGVTMADGAVSLANARTGWILAVLAILILAGASGLSRAKPFWYDELFTYYISGLPSLADSLHAVRDGADLNPPFLYLFTRFSQQAFGKSEVATRLPATLGFLLMQFCLFQFIARRAANTVAFAAAALPLITHALDYAYEARPYGLLMGFCALSAWMWQRAGDRPSPGRLLTLAAALSAMVMTHTLSVFAFPAFLGAECLRNLRAGRFAWRTWLAMLLPAGILAAVFYPPLILTQRQAVTAAFSPELSAIPGFYRYLFEPALLPLAAVAALLIRRPAGLPSAPAERSFALSELALAVGLAAVPIIAVGVSASVTGIYFPRYSLCAVIGIVILFAVILQRGLAHERHAVLVLGILLFTFLSNFVSLPSWKRPQPRLPASTDILRIEPALPFVVANGLEFLRLEFYAPPSVASRLVYVYDRETARRYTGSNPFDFALPDARRRFPLRARVEPYSRFVTTAGPFLLLASDTHPLDWILRKLLDDGRHVQLVAVKGANRLYKVMP